MAVVVGGIMSQRADGEGVFVEVLRIMQQGLHEVSAPHVVGQIAEKMAAVRVIAHVLNDRATVGVGLRFA